MEILILFGLILLNGVFAMSEIAIVTARKARLSKMASEGSRSAAIALKLGRIRPISSPPSRSASPA